ncbi:MAG: MFS transporter [Streptomycetales bacterium]
MKDEADVKRSASGAYAWVILAISVLIVFLVSGARSGFTVFVAPMERELGWDRASVSAAAALNLAVYGATQPLAGIFTSRFGVKRVLIGGTTLVATGFGGLFWVDSVWYLSLFYGVIFGIGISFASLIPASVLVARWFSHRQGLTQGMVAAARPAGQILFVPVVAALILGFGWRTSYLLTGLFVALAIPLIYWLVRERPSGESNGSARSPPIGTDAELENHHRLHTAQRSFVFWALAVGFFTCGFTDQFVALHLVPFAEGAGVPGVAAANLFALLSAAGVFGSLVSGWLSDVFSPKHCLVLAYGLRVLAFPMLLLFMVEANVLWLVSFAIIFGLTFIANMAPAVRIVRDTYGMEATGRLIGWLLFGHQIGGAAGTYLGGLIYKETHSYELAFILMILVAFLGVCFTIHLRPWQQVNPHRTAETSR